MEFSDETEKRYLKARVGQCKHFTWFDNCSYAGVCLHEKDGQIVGAYIVCPDNDDDLEACMECGGWDEQ